MGNTIDVTFIKSLANEKRLNIVLFLFKCSGATVGEISSTLKIPQSSTSEHISILNKNNILRSRREGNFIYYEVDRELMIDKLDSFANYLRNCC